MLMLKIITLYLLIERLKNVTANELHQFGLGHNVSELSIVKSIQLQPETFYLPQPYTQSTHSTKERANFRHEGNFYQPLFAGHPSKRDLNQQLLRYHEQPPAFYSNHVVHTVPWTTAKPLYYQYRKRHLVDHEMITPESIEREVYPVADQTSDYSVKKLIVRKPSDDQKEREKKAEDAVVVPTVNEMRYFHDIYMRLAGPHERNLYGHVEHGPHLFEKRFESQDGGNRFKGKVFWADKSGGYGEHHWDLAQGKLS